MVLCGLWYISRMKSLYIKAWLDIKRFRSLAECIRAFARELGRGFVEGRGLLLDPFFLFGHPFVSRLIVSFNSRNQGGK